MSDILEICNKRKMNIRGKKRNEIIDILVQQDNFLVKNKRILFLDTETTGLPDRIGFDNYYKPSLVEKYNNSRIIELAYVIVEDGKIVKKVSNLIKPDNFKIENSNIHGIDQTKAQEEGIDISIVLNEFELDIKQVNCIIAHNLLFDINILLSECYRYGKEDLINIINNVNKQCTMIQGKVKLNQYKYPKLIDLYKYYFNIEPVQEHRALSDTMLCIDCYFKMN